MNIFEKIKFFSCNAVFLVTTLICFSAMFFRYFIYQIDLNAQKSKSPEIVIKILPLVYILIITQINK